MRGRARGQQERIVVLAHQVETMARQKTLKSVKHYLPKSDAPMKTGASAMLAMVRRFKAKQDSANAAK